jgi:hypothetical protein
MKSTFALGLLSLFSASTEAGFIACTNENGVIFAGEIYDENHITGLRAIQAASARSKDVDLEVVEVNYSGGFTLKAKESLQDMTVHATIKAESSNGTSAATFDFQSGEERYQTKGTCTIQL